MFSTKKTTKPTIKVPTEQELLQRKVDDHVRQQMNKTFDKLQRDIIEKIETIVSEVELKNKNTESALLEIMEQIRNYRSAKLIADSFMQQSSNG